jgi:hypothetical protein
MSSKKNENELVFSVLAAETADMTPITDSKPRALEVGEVVCLRSGGAAMTLIALEGELASVVWEMTPRRIETRDWPLAALKRYEPGDL